MKNGKDKKTSQCLYRHQRLLALSFSDASIQFHEPI